MKSNFFKMQFFAFLILMAGMTMGTFEACTSVCEEEQIELINQAPQNTELMVTNTTKDTVTAWLTLNIYTDTLDNYFVQNVQSIFGIADSGAAGSFKLAPGDTLTYVSPLALAGNLCFGGQPVNCSNSQFPYGTNIFEFCLNNNFGVNPQESVEISCIAGVNSFLIGNLLGPNWIVTTGIDTVRVFKNGMLGQNTGRCGVFPTGCTNCTNQQGAPTCTPAIPFDRVNDKPICIIQRSANQSGGSVICTFNGYAPVICK